MTSRTTPHASLSTKPFTWSSTYAFVHRETIMKCFYIIQAVCGLPMKDAYQWTRSWTAQHALCMISTISLSGVCSLHKAHVTAQLSIAPRISCFLILCYHSVIANMPPKGRKPAKRWSLYPTLHDSVARLLEEEDLALDFYDVDTDTGDLDKRDTKIMGRFTCRNNRCGSSGWSSKKIAITVRMYPGQKYNARVYHQRCKSCNMISRPILDESYAERVTYWIKKWNGVEVVRPVTSGNSKGPHNNRLCEGCKAGHCSESGGDWIAQMQRWVLNYAPFCIQLIVIQIDYLIQAFWPFLFSIVYLQLSGFYWLWFQLPCSFGGLHGSKNRGKGIFKFTPNPSQYHDLMNVICCFSETSGSQFVARRIFPFLKYSKMSLWPD